MKKITLFLMMLLFLASTTLGSAMPGSKKLEESTEEPCTQTIYVSMPVYVLGLYMGTTIVPVEVEVDCPD